MGTKLTEGLSLAAEALAEGHCCDNCGRNDDWLAEAIRNERVILRCDDCMQTSIAIPLSKVMERVA